MMPKVFHSNPAFSTQRDTVRLRLLVDKSKPFGWVKITVDEEKRDENGVPVTFLLGTGAEASEGDEPTMVDHNEGDGGLADRPNTPPTRVQGGADGERVDDGLDAGALGLNNSLFANAIAGANAVSSQLIAGILDITKTSVRGSIDERSTAMVQATAAQGQVTHGLADTTAHSGHRPLSEEGSGSQKSGSSPQSDSDVSNALKRVADLVKEAQDKLTSR